MSVNALIQATESLKKREGTLLPTLKTIFFEELKYKYKKKIIKEVLLSYKGGSWGSTFFEKGICAKVLRSPDIRFGFIDYKNAEERYFTQKEIDNFNLKDNDILIIKSNGSLDLVGKSQIYKLNKEYPHVVASNFLMVLSPNDKIIYPEYLDLFLKSPESLVWRFDTQKTTTGLRNLNVQSFLNINIPVPETVDEQKELYNSFLTFLEGDIPKKEKNITKFYSLSKTKESLSTELNHQLAFVKKLRQQLLQEAVQGTLVKQNKKDEPSSELLKKIKAEKATLIQEKKIKADRELPPINEEEIPFAIPDNWVWCRLGEIAFNVEYGTSEKAEMSSDHIPILRMNNIQDGKLDFEKLKYVKSSIEDLPRLFLKKGDLLFNRTNSYELVGKSAIYHDADDKMTFASYLIRIQFSRMLSPDFVNFYINSSICRITQIEPDIIQQNGQANFNGSKLKNIICPLPPLAEQQRIVAKLEQLMQTCNALEASIQESTDLNERLLQQVLREALQPK